MTGHTKRQTCRVCGGTQLTKFLSLGPTPLANAFLRSTDEFPAEQSYPLDVYRCEGCSLVQLLDLIDPGTLFSHYIYVTGTSETVAEHNRIYSKTIVELLKLQPGNLVVEVASNDGSLLKCFEPYGMRTLGIEPAENISELARSQGVETLTRFFNEATGREVQETYGAAHVVIANNVLAHVDDTPDFLEGCKHVLKPDGLIVIEVPYLRDLLDRLEYDTIYHEHLCYFSVTTLMRLCDRVGLSIRRVEHVPLHGGSLRVYLGRQEVQGNHADAVLDYAAAETEAGFENMDRYERFAADVALNRQAIRRLLEKLKSDGKVVAGYGAPAKGNTLLNYCGIDTQLVSFTVDQNPLKIGHYTPGTHLPVLPVEALREREADFAFVLAWNFEEEIRRQQRDYAEAGGRFIIPIPEPRIV